MQTEIEVKFPNVDLAKIRTQLKELGAICEHPMRLMRRAIIETAELEAKRAFLRVRDEGDKTTLTYKQFDDFSLTGAKEIEVTVDDFENCIALLEQSGLVQKSFQESKRETWAIDGVEIVLDEWPHLRPYIEIEGPSEKKVRDIARKLGFEWTSAVFGRVTEIYQIQYPNGEATQLVNTPKIAFNDPLPKIITG